LAPARRVGTALLQLGNLVDLKMYGLASPGKHTALIELGAIPIDYHSQDFVETLRRAEPDGLDAVFNGMAEDYLRRGNGGAAARGTLVHYGAPQSLLRFLVFLAHFIWLNVVPDGKAILGYGTHRVDPRCSRKTGSHSSHCWLKAKSNPSSRRSSHPGSGPGESAAGKRQRRRQRRFAGAGIVVKSLRRATAARKHFIADSILLYAILDSSLQAGSG